MFPVRKCVSATSLGHCLCLQLPQARLLEMALHALCPFLSWMPVGHIFGGTPGSDLTDLLLQALSVPALRMPAAECLRTFAARKVSGGKPLWLGSCVAIKDYFSLLMCIKSARWFSKLMFSLTRTQEWVKTSEFLTMTPVQ